MQIQLSIKYYTTSQTEIYHNINIILILELDYISGIIFFMLVTYLFEFKKIILNIS